MFAQQGNWLFAVLLIAPVLTACGPRTVDVAGIWEGTWIAAETQSTGSFRVEIQQRGKSLSGPITLSLEWMPQARIEGVVDGQRVRWGVLRERLVVITFEGRITGNESAGTYTIGPSVRGTWNARRVGR